ncbi:MAG: bifunctional glycoside hydrolase 114/ polysaccharide deacetylase family protein [Pseudomonadota bacterium]
MIRNIVLLCLLLFPAFASAQFKSVAFYYASNPPLDELHAFDLVVFDPDQKVDPVRFRTPHNEAIAYVSIGEADPKRAYTRAMSAEWFLGMNPDWNTRIIDQGNPAWRRFFLDRVIEPLWSKGYRGFFLDTLDSWQQVAKTPAEQARQIDGLIDLIRSLKARHPDAKLILNRGFELLPRIHELVYAVAAESLFQQWNPKSKRYQPVGEADRQWLLERLRQARAWGLPVIVIDYVPPAKRALARETAKRIEALGFIPWVTDKDLASLGVGAVEVMPRKILGLYDSREARDPEYANIQRYAATPLNYLGYTLELHDLQQPLPAGILTGRYAGILLWPNSDSSGLKQHLQPWLLRQIDDGMRVIFMDFFGFPADADSLRPFGLDLSPPAEQGARLHVAHQDPMVGFEIQPLPSPYETLPLRLRDGRALLQVADDRGHTADVVGLTPWGGYALSPYDLVSMPNGDARWVIDPFRFFRAALALPAMPVPDTTTENGRRLMLAHIDGDGFASKAEWYQGPFSGEVMRREILEKYRIPTTVSMIQGEVAPNGAYPKLSPQLIPIARSIFALPWVEIASHSFSHPFNWQKLEDHEAAASERYHLDIPGYRFDLKTEIPGSAEYIDRVLAPPGKRCKVFLWTGNCVPDGQAIAMAYQSGLLNMNGGDTTITEGNNTITHVAPLGVSKGGWFQVYAPNQNENVYTRNWTGPFYGFERAIQTYKLTDSPRRLKPIDIYYHFYSATKRASLAALNKVYRWALAQPVMNIYASEYIDKVLDFNRTVVAQAGDGWLIRNRGDLRELRVPKSAGFPDPGHSENVVGYNAHGDSYYIHLGPGGEARVRLAQDAPAGPYLLEANAATSRFERAPDGLRLTLRGHLPLRFTLANMTGCSLLRDGRILKGQDLGQGLERFSLAGSSDAFTLQCAH